MSTLLIICGRIIGINALSWVVYFKESTYRKPLSLEGSPGFARTVKFYCCGSYQAISVDVN